MACKTTNAAYGLLPLRLKARGFCANERLFSYAMKAIPRESVHIFMQRACEYALYEDNLLVLRLARAAGCSWGKDWLTQAALVGNLDMLKFGLENDLEFSFGVLSSAIVSGSIHIVRWVERSRYQWSNHDACLVAIRNRNLEALSYLHSSRGLSVVLKDKHEAFDVVAEIGDLRIMKYLHRLYRDDEDMLDDQWVLTGVYYTAAHHGNVNIMSYLDNFVSVHPLDCRHIAYYGCTVDAFDHIVRRLENEYEQPYMLENVFVAAIKNGGLNLISYLVEKRWPCDRSVPLIIACILHDIETIQFLYDLGFPFTESCLVQAAKRDDLQIVQYLCDRQCPLSACAPFQAMIHCKGDLTILRYLRRIGCPWEDRSMLDGALGVQNENLLTYLLTEEGCVPTCEHFEETAKINNLRMIKLLHESRCPWNERVCFNAMMYSRGNLVSLRYLRDSGCPWDVHAMLGGAITLQDINVLRYLVDEMSQDTVSFKQRDILDDVKKDDVKWLREAKLRELAYYERLLLRGTFEV
ncbi:hypothetical protein CYMTET_41406 [Cymbomonas tetramitiformis]|uniref:Ankyrin repeat-containing domain n=1 Tax=Cymbomonas tetramitiformis TaxID=36881 RepID=A0AAE0F297_9CHLO|nr:hypothetical protein CYMTET_41406 [Cymbomonas tetramitiformis]